MSKSNSVYYNSKLNIIGIRSKRDYGDFLILNLNRPYERGLTDALEFNSVKNDWEYIGEI